MQLIALRIRNYGKPEGVKVWIILRYLWNICK
jgi:hypothetical protein